MQAQCPTCSQRIVVEDSRIPDRPFSVRCPKCQSAVKLPGRSAPPTPTPSSPATEELRPEVAAQLRREIGRADAAGEKARVLVALADQGLAESMGQALTRLGYIVETLDELDDGARLLEQGLYEIVVTGRGVALPGKNEMLAQRVSRLNPDSRRRVFLALVGDEFRTGDGTQAFTALADLVIHPRDAASAERVLLTTLAERVRLFRPLVEARRSYEAGNG
jgi:predicted Zn finger-like uncharacterized protein